MASEAWSWLLASIGIVIAIIYVCCLMYQLSLPGSRRLRRPCSKLIAAILTGIYMTIFAISYLKPENVKYNVTDAALTVFNYTSDNNKVLQYDLALNITVHNANTHIETRYDHVEACLLYQGFRLDTFIFDPFKPGHKTTSVLSHQFKGQQFVPLSTEQMKKLQMETSSRVYSIDVMIFLKIRSSYGSTEVKFKEKATCALHVPLISGGAGDSSGGGGGRSGFENNECRVIRYN